MRHRRKLQFGSILMILGALLAAIGEIINLQAPDVLSSLWRLSLALILGGTFALCLGLPIFAAVSEEIDGWGRIALSAATLAPGACVLGLALWHGSGRLRVVGISLLLCSLLNFACQFFQPIPWWMSNVSAVIVFLVLMWLGGTTFYEVKTSAKEKG